VTRGRVVDKTVAALARARDGVVSSSDLQALGVSRATIRSRLASGAWLRRGRAIVVPEASTTGDLQQAWILQCNASPKAVVSGPIAWRLQGWHIPGSEWIVADNTHQRASLPGLSLVRRRAGDFSERAGGLRLAYPMDALADTLIAVDWPRACAVADLVFQARVVDLSDLEAILHKRSGRGCRGAGQLRRLHERMGTGSKSEAEQRMGRLLRRSGTGPWIANYPHKDALGELVAEIDFALTSLRIAIEVDGRAFHSDRHSFERDRRRQNRLVLDGWLVLRFTWEQIVGDATGVISAIVAAVRQRTSRSLG